MDQKPADQKPAEEAFVTAAPVTGISCSLIDELPTMALPMPEMMTGLAWEGFDQEFSDYLM